MWFLKFVKVKMINDVNENGKKKLGDFFDLMFSVYVEDLRWFDLL